MWHSQEVSDLEPGNTNPGFQQGRLPSGKRDIKIIGEVGVGEGMKTGSLANLVNGQVQEVVIQPESIIILQYQCLKPTK